MRVLLLALLALSGALAQTRWPMITVNANGEIVLQSLTRAQSFQLTPVAVTTAPSSSGTASVSTATALTAGVAVYDLTTVSSPASGHGVALPTATLGARVELLQKATTAVSYTIYSQTNNFINADSSVSTFVAEAATRRVSCVAVSATRWDCQGSFPLNTGSSNQGRNLNWVATAPSAAATLSAANLIANTVFAVTPSTAVTLTLDTATNVIAAANSAAITTDAYEFTIFNGVTTEAAATSYLLTLAVSTGITNADTSAILAIPPGQRRTYVLYRTSSTTYSLYQKSTTRVMLAAVGSYATATTLSVSTTATAATVPGTALTTTANGVINAGRFYFSVTGVASVNAIVLITNNHAVDGQQAGCEVVSSTTTGGTKGASTCTCTIPASTYLYCSVITATANAEASTLYVSLGA